MTFGTGKNFRLVPANKIYAEIGQAKFLARPMYHTFTRCDTFHCFVGRGKRRAWETDVDAAMNAFSRSVILLYDKTSYRYRINEAGLDLFATKG